MKYDGFLLLYVVLLLSSSLPNVRATWTPSKQEFEEWALRIGKRYDDEKRKESAFAQWKLNSLTVERINNDTSSTWRATVENRFGDLSLQEYRKLVLIDRKSSKSFEEIAILKNTVNTISHSAPSGPRRSFQPAAAESFDWRDYGAVTPVKDQGNVGTCWAFSAIGNIEGQWYLAKKELVSLSEEFLVDCDGSFDAEQNHADCSIFGGWPYLAYGFIIDAGGVPTEADDPYCAGSGQCYPCMQGPVKYCGPPPYYCDEDRNATCSSTPKYAKINDWNAISQDESIVQTALSEIGPLSALLDATNLQFYESGVWSGHLENHPLASCSTDYLDHAVLLVGYGVDATTGTDYWTVKNSWGEKWGEDGYFRIVRGTGECGINTAVTTSIA
jgi:cathepsin F